MNEEQKAWFDAQTKEAKWVNPCVRSHGIGPEGSKCKGCALFIRKGYCSKKYFKCALRGNTNGPGTDHRANWPACGKFQPKSQ